MTGDPWFPWDECDDPALELHRGDRPALVLRQADEARRVGLAHVKSLAAGVVNGAVDWADLLDSGAGGHHA